MVWLASAIAEEEEHIDQTHHWLWPEGYEIVFGGIASVLIFSLLWWKAGPIVKKGLADRTARIQGEIDRAASALRQAETEAADIRKALGDIGSERARMLADADAQAEALLAEGRARLDTEVAELQAKADADIAAAMSRGSDEIRLEVAHLASTAADEVVVTTLDDDAQQRLIEDFISRVGAGATP
jgi:F-type H+-transporting ATPase subunit b